jgi:hypothetical protein
MQNEKDMKAKRSDETKEAKQKKQKENKQKNILKRNEGKTASNYFIL